MSALKTRAHARRRRSNLHCLAFDLRKVLASYRVLNQHDNEAHLEKEDHGIGVVLKHCYSCNEAGAILYSDARSCECGSLKILTMTYDDLNTFHFMENRRFRSETISDEVVKALTRFIRSSRIPRHPHASA